MTPLYKYIIAQGIPAEVNRAHTDAMGREGYKPGNGGEEIFNNVNALPAGSPSSCWLPTPVLCASSNMQLLRHTDKYVEDLQIEVLEDSTHWMLHDCPTEISFLLQKFLQRTKTRQAPKFLAES
jgi:hypothetical protein